MKAPVWIWMDMEMSGLNPQENVILELAVLATDAQLNILSEGLELCIHQPQVELDRMDTWCTEHHTQSGLIQRVQESQISLAHAEKSLLDWIAEQCPPRQAPLCGNSIHQDRKFLAQYMPNLEAYLHYRILDVSSIKIVAQQWYPNLRPPAKKASHRALDDIRESIEELRFYKENIFTK